MASTFMGLETGRRALTTNQWALQSTGNNIANAGTAGFSRQRLIMATTEQLSMSIGTGKMGQIGTGVKGELLERVRDVMLDKQYRDEATKTSYYGTKEAAFGRMEDIINEPSDTGLSKAFDGFWESLQTLSTNPQDSGARSVVRQKAETLTQTFNYMAKALNQVQGDLKSEIDVSTKKVNDLFKKIHNINAEIHTVEPLGVLPNALYDERDRYFDELAEYVDFEKVSVDSDAIQQGQLGNTVKTAEGRIDVRIKLPNGDKLLAVDSDLPKAGTLTFTTDANGLYTGFKTDSQTISFDTAGGFSSGRLIGLIEMYGHVENGQATGEYVNMQGHLDEMAATFAEAFNTAHTGNLKKDGTNGTNEFFVSSNGPITAKTISLGSEIKKSLDNIATSTDGNIGDSAGALKLANMKTASIRFDQSGTTTTIGSFYQNVIGDMAVATDQVARLGKSSAVLMESAEQRRMSVSAVSIDEEMTMMIQYQHAYNAAARNITTVDEMLDKIINGMGIVGR
ncbi:flagellar hook-associated protein FlgK [Exiguobacterium sp. N4-1P]|uniref:flagellar hook-associated protein FlgK n=1 Tax=Exiguobacterium sp. N4-1P TaxID=2051906 RepID=UPI000B5881C9|nr:flagellar hook-associated protein FlgK [Exiguobacterium sp. N4-1P]ASI36294.1 flagellar hook-associated protein FlgK [Exiguobacterium sp. N4-1P]